MEHPARMALEPLDDLGLLVGGIVVEHGMDHLAWRDDPLDGVEEADQLLMAVALHAAADDGAVENVQCCKQGGGAVALIVVGDGGAAAGLERQPGLGSIEGLDLRLLVDRQHHGMGRRVHVEAGVVNLTGFTPKSR